MKYSTRFLASTPVAHGVIIEYVAMVSDNGTSGEHAEFLEGAVRADFEAFLAPREL